MFAQSTWVAVHLIEPLALTYKHVNTFPVAALACSGAAFWRFSLPAPLLGKTIVSGFIHGINASIKVARDLLSNFCIIVVQ